MNSSQRSPLAIHILNHPTKGCKLLSVAYNANFAYDSTHQLQRSREKSLVSQSEEGLIASHARALASRQNKCRNAEFNPFLHAPIIHVIATFDDPITNSEQHQRDALVAAPHITV